jgi:hypothetical protein
MSSPRPYRASRSLADATAEIRAGAGSRYDPAVADACLALFEREEFTFGAPTGDSIQGGPKRQVRHAPPPWYLTDDGDKPLVVA